MFTLKKFANYFLIITIGVLLSFNPASALNLKDSFSTSADLDTFAKGSGYQEVNPPEYYVGLVLTALFSLLGIIAIALMIYSGVMWMTARGNESKVEKAKDNLLDLTIGLLFILGSYALTAFILRIIT